MKRFHVHVSVADLAQSVGFYSKLFAALPTVLKPDYAKWMLEDPRVNFAISAHEGKQGINHLGFQVDSDDELTELRAQARHAELQAVEELDASCCYASSDKHWIQDPQGIAWETFHTLGEIPVFGAAPIMSEPSSACGVSEAVESPESIASGCCGKAA
jgi:catechol 2,3-dioxygenase-like lactoylglutathione lyase family enzyme